MHNYHYVPGGEWVEQWHYSAESFITKDVSQICSLIATHIQEAAMMCGDKSPFAAVFSPFPEPSLGDGFKGL